MSDRAPAFQFYPKDYESDEYVKLMSLEQEGAYLRLLCHSWIHGSIPADVPTLAKICRVPTAKMARLWAGVKPCWKQAEDGRLVNGRQERDRAKSDAWSRAQAEKGKKGGRPKKPELSHGLAGGLDPAKAHESLPYSVLRTPYSGRTDERSADPPGKKNPFVGEKRESLELEALKLTREITAAREERQGKGQKLADDEPTDGAEIFVHAAKYEGAAPGRQKVNPANLSDDRLLNTVLDLRATLRDEQAKLRGVA